MTTHSTNYFNTFVEIAEDSPALTGTEPVLRGGRKTVAGYQYDMITSNPYAFTSDDVFFKVHAIRKDLADFELESARAEYFSKGQPCFRASPLTKRHGWGVHCNAEGKVALYARESKEYQQFLEDDKIVKVKAMRSKRS